MSQPHTGFGPYIKLISDALAAEANRNLKRHNLTLSQSHVLMALYRQNDFSASLKALESTFDVSQPTMAGLTARLERKGLIVGYTAPHDRRMKHVRLTAQGESICQASWQEILATEQRITAALSEDERTLLQDMLRRIYQSLR